MKKLLLFFVLSACVFVSCTKPSDNNTEDPAPAKSEHPYPAMIGNWAHVLRITDEGPAPGLNTERLSGKATLQLNKDATYTYVYIDNINSSYNKNISSTYQIGREQAGAGYFSISMNDLPGGLSLRVSNDTLSIFNGVGSDIYKKVN